MQFLYQDLFLISFIFVVCKYHLNQPITCVLKKHTYLYFALYALVGRTESYKELSSKPPPSSLIGIAPLLSLFMQVFLVVFFQVFSLLILWKQSWYKMHGTENDDQKTACHDNYALFSISAFQLISLAFVFSKGKPYRNPIYSNCKLNLNLSSFDLIDFLNLISFTCARSSYVFYYFYHYC